MSLTCAHCGELLDSKDDLRECSECYRAICVNCAKVYMGSDLCRPCFDELVDPDTDTSELYNDAADDNRDSPPESPDTLDD